MKKPVFIFPLLLAWASGCALDTVNRPELLISPIDDEDPSGLSAVLLEDDVAHERSFSFSLYLTRKPSSDVTVRISSDISGEVSILDEVRVFTPENYDMIQSVRVAGMMDSRVDGDCPVGILFDMSSEDAVYDGRRLERKVSVTDIDKVGIELSHDSLETDENGKSVNVRARLASIPYASVTVPLMLSDPDEAVLSVERFVIEPEAWQSEQIVTIKGLPDNRKDGNKKYLLEFGAAESEDEHYSSFQLDALELTNMDVNRAGVEVTAEHSLATTEAGGSVSVEVSLASEPSSDVTMLVSVSDDTEAEVSPTEIVFTPDNWYERQKITVTGRDDSESDGDQSFMLVFSPLASLDLNYGGIVPDPIEMKNIDNDKAGIDIRPVPLSCEEGAMLRVSAQLRTMPQNPVTLRPVITDSDGRETDEASIAGDAVELSYAQADYNQPQEFDIQCLTDDVVDGDQVWRLSFAVTSDGADYSDPDQNFSVEGRTVDVDKGGFEVQCDRYDIQEGEAISCQVVLNSKPQNAVTIHVESSDPEYGVQVSSGAPGIVFEANDPEWNSGKTFSFIGSTDDVVDGTKNVRLSFASDSEDSNFLIDSENSRVIDVTVTDINDNKIVIMDGYDLVLNEKDISSHEIRLKLLGKPDKDVFVKAVLSGNDIKMSEQIMTIHPEDWNKETVFKYSTVDNSVADNDRTATIVFETLSNDPKFNNLTAKSELISIIDDETSNLKMTVKSSIYKVSCKYNNGGNSNGPVGELKLTLNAQPKKDVKFVLTLRDKDGKVLTKNKDDVSLGDAGRAVFTTKNWNTGISVSIYAPNELSKPDKAYYENVYVTADVLDASGTGYENFKFGNSQRVFAMQAFCDPKGFVYQGKASEVSLPRGYYEMEVKGAGGGSYDTGGSSYYSYGGVGARAHAVFALKQAQKVYVTVGGKGSTCYNGRSGGGYNGGSCGSSGLTFWGYGGGGATDIRIGANSYASRVIVGGGGGGGLYIDLAKYKNTSGAGAGGQYSGGSGRKGTDAHSATSGGSLNSCNNGKGGCGFGEPSAKADGVRRGGGGGGWFSGLAGQDTNVSGAGGSSYIHGYTTSSSRCQLKDTVIKYYSNGNYGIGAARDTDGSASIKVYPKEI